MSILPKATYGFHAIFINIPVVFFTEVEKTLLQMYMEPQKTLDSQRNHKKKNNAGGITLSDFKQWYIAILINTVWYCHKNKETSGTEP